MKKKSRVRTMTELALLTAIVLLMAFTPLGYLQVGVLAITFIVIPVAIGSVILGPAAGAFLGLVFGLTSFFQAMAGGSALGTFLFNYNPFLTAILCIVPRVIVGLLPAYIYRLMGRLCRTDTVNVSVACIMAPILNTLLYMSCLLLLFQEPLKGFMNYTGDGGLVFLGALLASVAVNATAEAVSCLVVATAVCKALQKTVNKTTA